jgi:hypothetical protein
MLTADHGGRHARPSNWTRMVISEGAQPWTVVYDQSLVSAMTTYRQSETTTNEQP